ncbi:MAG: DUF4388 domain-containing protein [Acidobacteriota bacterium]
MAFQGSLEELHLPDLIQLVSVSGKTGKFMLSNGDQTGIIYLLDGRIVHAELEGQVGEEAVYSLAIWSKGEFKFEPDVRTDHKTITRSNTNLLMEAARRLDEWRVLSKKIPNLDMIPEFTILDRKDRRQINLNTSEWQILSQVNGQQSIPAIAKITGMSLFDVSKILFGMITSGLIHLKNP